MTPLILASGSPRRAAILRAQGVEFVVEKTDAPEISVPGDPVRTVTENARAKLRSCAAGRPGRRVLAADTIVWHAGTIYGKPRDAAEARVFLRTLSGVTHTVFTGVAFTDGARERTVCCRSDVTFRELSDAEIDDYIAAVNPLDRAGAYDIDESGDRLVASYTGSYENIMGLPTEPLAEFGIPRADPAAQV